MSTAYRVRPELPWDYMFANLPEGISEEIVPPGPGPNDKGTTEDRRCLTNGSGGYLWAYRVGDGEDTNFERFGINYNAAAEILDALSEKFNVQVFSEHDEEFWDPDELDEDEEFEQSVDDTGLAD